MKLTRSKYLIITLIIMSAFIYQVISLLYQGNQVIKNYEKDIIQDAQTLINVSVSNKNGVTDMLYNNLDRSVNQIMYEAKHNIRKDENRDLLYQLLLNQYNSMKEIGIVQFHFHLPTSESYLRFHDPDRYGDLLNGIRTSLDLVEKRDTLVVGYEEGSNQGGYRYVYPLYYEEAFVGSVEMTYAIDKIVNPIEKTKDLYFLLVMNKDIIDKKSNSLEETIYREDPMVTFGYISQKPYDEMLKKMDMSKAVFKDLNMDLEVYLKENPNLSYLVHRSEKQEFYWLMNIPLIDINNRVIGQILFYKNDHVLQVLESNYIKSIHSTMTLTVFALGLLMISYLFFCKVNKKATLDNLTKLYSRHAFNDYVVGKIVSGVCMMIDIDDFKDINDRYGHIKGDEVLKELGKCIIDHIRHGDYAVRWGGEEFLVLMDTAYEIGLKRAQTLVDDIGNRDFAGLKITVSIGVSILGEDNIQSIKESDIALYQAKRSGKNKVLSYVELN